MIGPHRKSSARVARVTPCGRDLGPNNGWVVELDGQTKTALEVGRTRLLVAGFVFALAFLGVAGRLIDLSLFGAVGEPLRAEAPSADELRPTRAAILDRNGEILATTLPVASIYANPHEIRDPVLAASRLATALPDIDPGEIRDRLASDRSFIWIKRHITPREMAAVNRLGIPGVRFQREETRVYPHGSLVSQVVGLTDIDGHGIAGMESAENGLLSDGRTPLRLSIDLRIQYIMAEELSAAMKTFDGIGAAGLVVDAHTGEILSMVSLPTFDPNDPAAAGPAARFNRASLGVYEMGSVFKLATAAMALDSGVVHLTDGFDVTHPIRVGRFRINDYHPIKGTISIPEIIMHSSNIGTVHMAMEAGTDRLLAFYGALGLTKRLKYELPETGEPLLPHPWREINTMTASYGQGIAVTPLQVVRATAAIANGGELPTLTLMHRTPDQRGRVTRVLTEETSRQMRWLMRLVVEKGTGRKADAPGYLVGGKTGTADKPSPKGGYAKNKRIASFIGAFPMDDPQYVIFAMVDEPKGIKATYGYATGGWVTAPVVSRVVERIAPLLGIAPRRGDDELDTERKIVPVVYRGTELAAR
ncbi:cell division protein FtsI (penicillin-binding protein 3) [Tistlia consotensis]|uniref:Cell division protein FtsI (Penicillin-binding protein 3) n=1 Tax=Tistlia consotensis USBA 355 TaxID=560819 RepID=A0A1Y6CJS5_9PROT|nr:penicillin-binding protein 2 [Tistlia consotensis]SMF70999.1 cell division protein FtsI (penicillin-binding protein 3) [Tistlia consotensis USBA 355]SNS07083.1 cell division protein FtsI (penicillin-binding protein 3) [Tistlia consotensis]